MENIYRKCVGIVLCNKENKVLWCERKDTPGQWQFPQGGIDDGETYIEAAKRELKEETSVVSVEKIAAIEEPILYDFPVHIAKRLNKRGQAMNWVLYRFIGNDSEINLQTKIPEFVNWKWVDIDEAPKNIVDFKQEVYQKMVNQFRTYLGEVGKNE